MPEHARTRNCKSRNGKAPRRRRVLGRGTDAGAFLTFGVIPLTTAPAANADEFDVIIDPLINSRAGLLDPAVALDPGAGLDLGSLGAGAAEAATAVPAAHRAATAARVTTTINTQFQGA